MAFYESWRSMLRWNHGVLIMAFYESWRSTNHGVLCCVGIMAPYHALPVFARFQCVKATCRCSAVFVRTGWQVPVGAAGSVCTSSCCGWILGAWCNYMPLPPESERELYVHLPVWVGLLVRGATVCPYLKDLSENCMCIYQLWVGLLLRGAITCPCL